MGAEGYHVLWNQRARLARESGLHVERIEHLLGRYGSAIHDLLAEVARDPELGKPLEGADDYLRVEIRYAASHEGAQHLDDVLARRTRISIETFDRRARGAADGRRAGLVRRAARQQVDLYRQRVAAERDSQTKPDDQAADEARIAVPDFTARDLT